MRWRLTRCCDSSLPVPVCGSCVSSSRALENLTGADLMKLFPSPRIPTAKIPECKPHLDRGDHLRLYRFSPKDYLELAAVFNGPHPETGEELVVIDKGPEGVAPPDLPPQPAVFAPDYSPEDVAQIARKLRERAGLPRQATGVVAEGNRVRKKTGRKRSRAGGQRRPRSAERGRQCERERSVVDGTPRGDRSV